jgi:hypothetical protein
MKNSILFSLFAALLLFFSAKATAQTACDTCVTAQIATSYCPPIVKKQMGKVGKDTLTDNRDHTAVATRMKNKIDANNAALTQSLALKASQAALNTETINRVNSDNALIGALDTKANQTSLAAEAEMRRIADSIAQNNINDVNFNLAAEKARALAAEAAKSDTAHTHTLQKITDRDSVTTHEIIAKRLYAFGAGNLASNIAFGFNTLNNITTGQNNIAIGRRSLEFTTTGYGNVAIGRQPLGSNISGVYNTAIGFNNLGSCTSCNYNVALGGGEVMLYNVSGVANIAIGFSALRSSLSNSNIAIGYNAGKDITTGYNNVIVGTDIQVLNAGNNQLNINSWITGINGKIAMPFVPFYANDAAADADAMLVSGSFYRITGSRILYQK